MTLYCPHCGEPVFQPRVGLTKRQAQVLAYLRSYMADTYGIAPSFDDIMSATGLLSKSGVHRILKILEERGHITRIHGHARAIALVQPREAA